MRIPVKYECNSFNLLIYVDIPKYKVPSKVLQRPNMNQENEVNVK